MNNKTDSIYLQIAGFMIKIEFHKTENIFFKNKLIYDINTIYKGFIFKEGRSNLLNIDFIVRFLDQKIPKFKAKKTKNSYMIYVYFYEEKKKEVNTFYNVSLKQFEYLIFKVLMKLVASERGFVLHASAVNFRNELFLFTGSSGAGKSTAATLLGKKYKILADDSGFIRKKDNEYFFYQTHSIDKCYRIKREKKAYKINKVFFLRKKRFFKIEKVNNKTNIYNYLARQLWATPDDVGQQVVNLSKFIKKFKHFYYLCFANDEQKMLDFFETNQVLQEV